MKSTEVIEEILKTSNKEKIEVRLKYLFRSYVTKTNLWFLLEEEETVSYLVLHTIEATKKGMFSLNTAFVEGKLIDLLRKRKAKKRLQLFLALTEELKEMFEYEKGRDQIEQLEQYDYIAKTYGENFAKYLVTGEYDIEDLQQVEGCSRATLYRKLKLMREQNDFSE